MWVVPTGDDRLVSLRKLREQLKTAVGKAKAPSGHAEAHGETVKESHAKANAAAATDATRTTATRATRTKLHEVARRWPRSD
jgi:hypothetical protein